MCRLTFLAISRAFFATPAMALRERSLSCTFFEYYVGYVEVSVQVVVEVVFYEVAYEFGYCWAVGAYVARSEACFGL